MFHRLSIRFKLAVLLSLCAGAALLISSAVTLASNYLSQRDASLRQLVQLAAVSSDNLRAALAFHDAASAQRLLQPLRANPHIRLALIEDRQGQVFARYVAASVTEPDMQQDQSLVRAAMTPFEASAQAGWPGIERVSWDAITVIRPILFDEQVIGRLAIVSDTQALKSQISEHLLFQGLLSLATLSVIVLISIPLQRLFTHPIFELLAAMQHVSRTRSYEMQFLNRRHDEFRELIDGFNTMLAAIRERDERLSHLASTDALTGLANRRQALDTLAQMVQRARRKSEPIGVIMLDIDHFKRVNDQHGHPAGDAVLRQVAALMGGCARSVDLVARLGGEEFLILCDDSDSSATFQIAERVRELVAQHVFVHEAVQLRLSVSLGVCAAVPESEQAQVLIQHADACLYRAKQTGRNKTVVWETL